MPPGARPTTARVLGYASASRPGAGGGWALGARAGQLRARYGGDAAGVWTDAADGAQLRANLEGLPGFGEMKIKSLGAVLAKQFGVEAARELVPWHPTLGDVDSPEALAEYQAAKRTHKAAGSKGAAPAAPPGA